MLNIKNYVLIKQRIIINSAWYNNFLFYMYVNNKSFNFRFLQGITTQKTIVYKFDVGIYKEY